MKFIRTIKLMVVLFAMIFVNVNYSIAQVNEGNVFSPYSMYGLGILGGQGTAAIQGMSGTSIAVKNPYVVNTNNPAAYTVAPSQTMLFSFGMMGNNEYLKTSTGQTSSNTFTLSDLALQFPIAKNVGMALSYSPYSSVGYGMSIYDDNEDYVTDIGHIQYDYYGTGGVALVKAGIAWEPLKGLSVGANLINYFGNISRTALVSIYPITSQNVVYRSTYSMKNSYINKFGGEFGLQYDINLKHNRFITLGLVYTPKLNTDIELSEYIYTTSDNLSDSVYYSEVTNSLTIPTKISAGVSYRTSKVTIATDYIQQNWENAMEIDAADNIQFSKMREITAGFEYTPSRFDLRNALKRWTYRAGLKTATSYMMVNNSSIREYSGSIGVGVPLQRMGGSMMNIAAEVGKRGSVKADGIIDETFFKVSVGFSLFTINEWFVRHKFK